MKTAYLLCLRLVLGLLLASQYNTGWAQALRPEWQSRAYSFLGAYFGAMPATQPYRLDTHLLPVVSPYDLHPDLRTVLSANYLTRHQFLTSVKADTLLTEADFAAMRAQLVGWQTVPAWSVARLRAQHIGTLTRRQRRAPVQFSPGFTTYKVFPPLFSQSGRIALFYVENYCGLDCAGGDIHILRQQADGSWKQVFDCPAFIS